MKKGILIALLIVCILILGALILNLANGGVWIVRGLDGADGIDGSDGVDGSDGKDGKDGEDGQNGKDGEDGKDGANGKSAYELAVEEGFQGSLHEWLLLLAVRGADGKDGRPGADGAGIADVRINGQGDLIVILTNGKTVNAGHVGGEGVLEEEPDAQGFYPVYETVILENVEQSLNLRLTPDTDSGVILTSIVKGTELLRIGDQRTENGFSKFLYNGVECYARSRYFELKYVYEGELPPINLPKRVVLTAGEQTWFMTDQILPERTEDFKVTYSYSGKGERVFDGSDAFAITPAWTGTVAGGVHPPETATLTVRVEKQVDGELRIIAERAVEIVIVEKQAALSLTGLIIGDSRISDGALVSDLAEKMSGLSLIGTRSVRYSGVCHEGRGAWSTSHYLNNATLKVEDTVMENAFYNPAIEGFDFAYYMTNKVSAEKLDFVVINLGANDAFSKDSVKNIERMIESIHAYSAEIQVIVMTEYVSPERGYYLSQTYNTDVHAMRDRQFRYFAYLSEQFEGREAEGVHLLANYLSINGWSDWQRKTVATANGNEERIHDVIHLGTNGYLKEAAMLRSYLYWLFGAQTP